jgi:hypothetical protein
MVLCGMTDRSIAILGMAALALVLVGTLTIGASPAFEVLAIGAAGIAAALAVHRMTRTAHLRRRRPSHARR